MEDFVIYGDTDSLFICIYNMIEKHDLLDIWKKLSEDDRVKYCIKIGKSIEKYVNKKSFEETQVHDMNSQEKDFKINFKSETVAKSGVWVAKKKYFLYISDNEGVKPEDPLKVTGLEVVRSDTPTIVKPMLKDIMLSVLEAENDEILFEKIEKYKEELNNTIPEDIAENIGVHNIDQYISIENECKKGTPRHVKGIAALRLITDALSLQNKVDIIQEGEKAKIVYLKPNKWNIETLAFNRWLPEFTEAGLEIDYKKMIDKNLIKKIEMFLNPIDKSSLLNESSQIFNEFF